MVAVQQNRNAFSTGKCNRPGECVCCVKALRVIIHTLLIQTSSWLRRIQKDRSAFAVSKFKIRVIVPSWSGSLYIGKCVGNIPEKVPISIGREAVSFCNYIKTGGQKPQQRGHGSDRCVQIHIWCIDDIADLLQFRCIGFVQSISSRQQPGAGRAIRCIVDNKGCSAQRQRILLTPVLVSSARLPF